MNDAKLAYLVKALKKIHGNVFGPKAANAVGSGKIAVDKSDIADLIVIDCQLP